MNEIEKTIKLMPGAPLDAKGSAPYYKSATEFASKLKKPRRLRKRDIPLYAHHWGVGELEVLNLLEKHCKVSGSGKGQRWIAPAGSN